MIVNQGTTMDGPGQLWSPFTNQSLSYYGGIQQAATSSLHVRLLGHHESSKVSLAASELYEGMGVAIVAGAGVEQMRRVPGVRAPDVVVLDRPCAVPVSCISPSSSLWCFFFLMFGGM